MARKKVRNTNSTPNEQKGVKTPFAQTECDLKIPSGHPGRKIPATEEENSFFINLESGNATDIEVFTALQRYKQIRTVLYRDDLRVVECICRTKKEREAFLENVIPIPNKEPIKPIKPRHLVPRLLYIRLANLPVDTVESTVGEAIIDYWSKYGDVVDAAPHTIKGTHWNTRRWDLLLAIEQPAQKLEAPVAFNLLGRKIVAAWPGSPPSCLACQSAGHQAKKCPLRKSKAGEAFDPERRSMSHPSYADATKSGPDSSPVPQIQPKSSESAKSGNTEDQSTSSPGSTSKSVQDIKSGVYASIHNPSTQKTAAPGSEVAAAEETSETTTEIEEDTRPSTPISQIIQSPAEQTTPRSEAGKRVSRFDAEKAMRQLLPSDVIIYLDASYQCVVCGGEDHVGQACDYRWSELESDQAERVTSNIREVMRLQKERLKKTRSTRSQRSSSSTSTPMSMDSQAPETRSSKKTRK